MSEDHELQRSWLHKLGIFLIKAISCNDRRPLSQVNQLQMQLQEGAVHVIT